jgi:hypothetical protein
MKTGRFVLKNLKLFLLLQKVFLMKFLKIILIINLVLICLFPISCIQATEVFEDDKNKKEISTGVGINKVNKISQNFFNLEISYKKDNVQSGVKFDYVSLNNLSRGIHSNYFTLRDDGKYFLNDKNYIMSHTRYSKFNNYSNIDSTDTILSVGAGKLLTKNISLDLSFGVRSNNSTYNILNINQKFTELLFRPSIFYRTNLNELLELDIKYAKVFTYSSSIEQVNVKFIIKSREKISYAIEYNI